MIDAWIETLGRSFSAADYLYWTRIQCVAWTCADLAIVYFFIRIANLCRSITGTRRHRLSYVVLAASALPLPGVTLADSGGIIFLVELFITMPHFILILYLLAANRRVGPEALSMLLARKEGGGRNGEDQ